MFKWLNRLTRLVDEHAHRRHERRVRSRPGCPVEGLAEPGRFVGAEDQLFEDADAGLAALVDPAQKSLVDTLGIETARRVLLRFGFADGYHDAVNLRARSNWDSPVAGLRARVRR